MRVRPQSESLQSEALTFSEFPIAQEPRNIKLVLAYDGTDFHGWQVQPNIATVQGVLQHTLQKLCQEDIVVHGSGRTDAGVHARGQVAHFKTVSKISEANLQHALNQLLPDSIRIYDCREVEPTFNARYSAKSKMYSYNILCQPICSPFRRRYSYHVSFDMNVEKMALAAQCFVGEHDFTSFCDAQDESLSKVRTVFLSEVEKEGRGQLVVCRVEANGFLHRMVRAIVGTLIEVGRGRLEPDALMALLEARNRTAAPWTAPAEGLCLEWVKY
jgi:tRNA pseudouridine38-40 synthase